jgi:tetratricopeptide (TPR) repeat protein
MAEAHAGLAGAAAALRRPDQVYASLAEAIRLKPGLASAHVRLANQLAADGRVNEAAQQLREALAIDPNQPAWREALARLEGR